MIRKSIRYHVLLDEFSSLLLANLLVLLLSLFEGLLEEVGICIG